MANKKAEENGQVEEAESMEDEEIEKKSVQFYPFLLQQIYL